MHVTIITSARFDEATGACGWAAVGQASDDVFRAGGRLLKAPGNAADASIMAGVNGIHHAIVTGAVGKGDTVIVGLEEIDAVVSLAMASRGPSERVTKVGNKAGEVLARWESELGLNFEFRHASSRARFEGMTWQRNACEDMARLAAAKEPKVAEPEAPMLKVA